MAIAMDGLNATRAGIFTGTIPDALPDLIWAKPGEDLGAPVYVSGTTVITARGSNANVGGPEIVAYSLTDGAELWATKCPTVGDTRPWSWPVGIANANVYCTRLPTTFSDGPLYALKLSDGTDAWTSAKNTNEFRQTNGGCGAIAANGDYIGFTEVPEIVRIKASDGTTVASSGGLALVVGRQLCIGVFEGIEYVFVSSINGAQGDAYPPELLLDATVDVYLASNLTFVAKGVQFWKGTSDLSMCYYAAASRVVAYEWAGYTDTPNYICGVYSFDGSKLLSMGALGVELGFTQAKPARITAAGEIPIISTASTVYGVPGPPQLIFMTPEGAISRRIGYIPWAAYASFDFLSDGSQRGIFATRGQFGTLQMLEGTRFKWTTPMNNSYYTRPWLTSTSRLIVNADGGCYCYGPQGTGTPHKPPQEFE